MSGETFELTRETLERQKAFFIGVRDELAQASADDFFSAGAKYFGWLFLVVVVLLVAMSLMMLASTFLQPDPRKSLALFLVTSLGAIAVMGVRDVFRRSVMTNGFSFRAWRAWHTATPMTVTWRLENGTLTYQKTISVEGQRVYRVQNWIGLESLVFPCSDVTKAAQLEADLLKIGGISGNRGFPKRLSGKQLVGYLWFLALYVVLAVKFLSV